MFVILDKKTESIWFVDAAKTRMILCETESDAAKAVQKLHEKTKKEFSYAELDAKASFGYWFLNDQEGRQYNLEPGITVAFRTKKSAWGYSGSVFHATSNILVPVPA